MIAGSDYALIDNAFNQTTAQVAGALAVIAGQAGIGSVPEPTTLGLLGMSATGLLGRRRRRQA